MKPQKPVRSPFSPAPLSLALACALGGGWAHANPVGGVAVHGTAQMSNPAANQLVVTTSNGAGTNHSVINWQSFSIPGGSTTQIVQPNAGSLSINRVTTTNNPSLIYGTLSSNGQVLLVNPAGVTVGAGAVVDTAGFQASTLGLSEADAIAGRLRFEGAGGDIQVQGQVVAREGDVVLLAPQVTVEAGGVVRAPNGSVVLAAGQKAELTGRGLEGIQLQVQAPGDRAVNLGTLSGDAVGIFAGTLKHSGVIQATAVMTEGGRVVLKAQELAEIGGATRAERLERLGGLFQATARLVDVKSDAVIDASGAQGGGEVLIGGGWQGNDARVANAQQTLVRSGAQIRADATENGDGGTVVVWADQTTRYYGNISARGGAHGGDGGTVEVSGKQNLGFSGTVDTQAPQGRIGKLLLDPTDIAIVAGGASPVGAGDAFADPGALVNIDPAALQALGADVTLQATQDVTILNDISMTTNGADLTIQAGRNIVVNANITTTNGVVTLSSSDPASGAAAPSSINVQGNIGTRGVSGTDVGASIMLNNQSTSGGNITLNGNLAAGAGFVDLNIANGYIDQTGGGISASGGLRVQAVGGDVTLDGNNSINTLAASVTGGTGTRTLEVNNTSGLLSVGTVNGLSGVTTGHFTLDTNGAVTQTASVIASGTTTINAGGGDVTLTNSGNDFGTLAVTAGSLDVFDANNLALGQITANAMGPVPSPVTIEAAGNITWSAGNINTGGATIVDALTLTAQQIGTAAAPIQVDPGVFGEVILTSTRTTAGAGVFVRQVGTTLLNTANYRVFTDNGTTQTVQLEGDALTVGIGGFSTMGSAFANDDLVFVARADNQNLTVTNTANFQANSVKLRAEGVASDVVMGTFTLTAPQGLTAYSMQRDVVVNGPVQIASAVSTAGITLAAANNVDLSGNLITRGGSVSVTAGKTGFDGSIAFEGTLNGSIGGGGNITTSPAPAPATGNGGNVTLTVEGSFGTLEVGDITTSGGDATTLVAAGNAGNITLSVGQDIIDMGELVARGGNANTDQPTGGNGGAIQVSVNTGAGSTTSGLSGLVIDTTGGDGGEPGGTGGAAGSVLVESGTGLTLSGTNTVVAVSGSGGTGAGDAGATAAVTFKAINGDLQLNGNLDVNNASGMAGTLGQGAAASATSLTSLTGALTQAASTTLTTNGGILRFSAQGAVTLNETANTIGETDGTAAGNVAISGLSGVGDNGISTSVGTIALTGVASGTLNIQGPLSAPGNITLTGDVIEVQDPVTSSGGDITVTGNDIWIRAIPGTPAPAAPSGTGSLSGGTITLNAPGISVDGKLYPGRSGAIGNLIVNGAMTMHSGSELHIDFHGNNHDAVDASGGSVTFDAGAKLITAATTMPSNASYAIVTGTTTGTLPTLSGTVQGTLQFGSLYLITSNVLTGDTGVGLMVDQFTELFTQEVGAAGDGLLPELVNDPEQALADDDIVVGDTTCRPR